MVLGKRTGYIHLTQNELHRIAIFHQIAFLTTSPRLSRYRKSEQYRQ